MTAREYYRSVQAAISDTPHVIASNVSFDEIVANECYIRGRLTLIGGFELHIVEYVITEPDIGRSKYRYHLQRTDGTLVARWDNVPHHRGASTFPNHRHHASGSIHPSPPWMCFKS